MAKKTNTDDGDGNMENFNVAGDDARLSTLTGINGHGQPLLHPRQAPWSEYQTVPAGGHVPHDVAAGAPLVAEPSAALHGGIEDAKAKCEVVVAALGGRARSISDGG